MDRRVNQTIQDAAKDAPAALVSALILALDHKRITIGNNQAAHGLSVGDWVYRNSGVWTLADRSSAATLAEGVVVRESTNDVEVIPSGLAEGLSGLTANTVYYLDAAGAITSTKPTSGIVQVVGRTVSTTAIQVAIVTEALTLSSSAFTAGDLTVNGDLEVTGQAGIGVTPTTNYLQHIQSSLTSLTSSHRHLFVDHQGASTVSSIIAEVATLAADETEVLRLTGDALLTGKALNISVDAPAQTSTRAIEISHVISSAVAANRVGSFVDAIVDRTMTHTAGLVSDDYDLASLTRTNHMNGAGGTLNADGSVLRLQNVATETAGTLNDSVDVLEIVQDADSGGRGIIVDQNGNDFAIEVDFDGDDAGTLWAMKVTADNAGAGVGAGIDFSAMAVDEPLLKSAADAITGVGTISHQVPVDIGGTVFYLVAYTHGT